MEKNFDRIFRAVHARNAIQILEEIFQSVAVEAAFQAATDGQLVLMKQLVFAETRPLPYDSLIADDA